MNIYRRYHTLSHVAVLLGMLTFCVADGRPGIALLASVVVAGSWTLFRDNAISPLPRWSINLLLLGATANMFRLVFLSALPLQDVAISILAEYLIYLQLIKLFESRTPRDQTQLLVLNVMLVIGAVLTSVTLEVGIMLALYAPVFLATVLLFQLYAGQHRAIAPRHRPIPQVVSLVTSAGRRVTRDLRLTTALATILIALGAVGVFLVMPRRIGDDLAGQIANASAGATADFTDQVQLRSSGLISESRDIVLEFDLFIGGQKDDLSRNRYLRGTVLDEYDPDRGIWSRSSALQYRDKHQSSRVRGQARGDEELPPPLFPATAFEQVVTLRNKSTDHLFALWRPVQVACDKQLPIFLNEEDATLRMPNPRRGMLTYRVRSYENILDPDETPDDIERRAESPGVFEGSAIESYARGLLREAGIERDPDGRDDQRILQLFERHLRDNFTYTLELIPPPEDTDPLESFLTDTRAGHCEYFASAMAAMAQAIGIDARVVTGYVTNEVDPATGAYIVRKRHAHAWVEARVTILHDADPTDGVVDVGYVPRWETFDPTPPSELRALNADSTGLVAWAQRMLDRAEQLWVRNVVAFGADQQKNVLGESGFAALDLGRLAESLAGFPRMSLRRAFQFITTAVISFVVFVGVLLLARHAIAWALARTAGRARRWWLGRTNPPAARRLRQIDLYDRMLRLLEKSGLPKPDTIPPLAFARALRPARPDAADRVERLAALYYAVRFGHVPLTAQRLADAESDLRALRESLRTPAAS